jgi:hypothetical protein
MPNSRDRWRSACRSKHTESCVIVSVGGDRIVEHRRVQRAPLTAPPPPPSALLLLYAQPLVRIAALKTTAIVLTPQELLISLGAEPIPVPEPFPGTFRFHLHNRLTSALPATARPVIGCRRVNGQPGIRVHECARSVDPARRHPRCA